MERAEGQVSFALCAPEVEAVLPNPDPDPNPDPNPNPNPNPIPNPNWRGTDSTLGRFRALVLTIAFVQGSDPEEG